MTGNRAVVALVRHGAASAGAALITVAIMLVMQTLIATNRAELGKSGTRHFVDFIRADRAEAIEVKERRREPPPPPETPPETPTQAPRDLLDPAGSSVNIPPFSVPVDLSIRGLNLQVLEGDYLPIVKIAPIYPHNAVSQGIEGHVVVEFTVTTSGAVRDVVVIDAVPKGVFEKSAIDAALKFRYRPRVVDGEAIEVHGVRNVFRFSLTD